MRCKGCNSELSDNDMRRKDLDGSFMDLCGVCYRTSELVRADTFMEFKEYDHGLLTEGPLRYKVEKSND